MSHCLDPCMKGVRLIKRSYLWSIWIAVCSLAVLSIGAAAAEKKPLAPPNPSAIFEQARTAEHRVLFAQNFEGSVAENYMSIWYTYPGNQCRMVFADVSEEQAFSGKRSYKVQVEFQPAKIPRVYIRLPLQIPIWSYLKLSWRIRTETSPKAITGPYHGFSEGEAGGNDDLLFKGAGLKVSEEKGWELWQAEMRSDGVNIGQYASGVSLCMVLGPISEVTTVTFYVDDITIEGRLPSDWKKQWADVYRYFTVYADRDRRTSAARRLTDVKTWQIELEKRYSALSAPSGAPALLLEQYNTVAVKVKETLDKAAPLATAVEKELADEKTRLTASIHPVERLLMEARYYLNIAEAYPIYARKYREPGYLTFTLDITQSYPILPAGPNADREEESYYKDFQTEGSFENPQLLPNTNPVPAKPSRTLSGFGCRGIYVPYSFALRAGAEMQDIVFSVSDLIFGQNRIPASQADIRVVTPWYRPSRYRPWGGKPCLTNEILLHDPKFAVPVDNEQRNEYQNPKYGDDTDKLQPVTIAAGTTRQFYLLVKVPDKAAAGMYKGTVTGRAKDGTVVTWTLALEVLPFALEPTPYAYSAYYRSYLVDEEHRKKEGINSENAFEIHRTASQMEAEFVNMAEHGMNTLNLYGGTVVRTDDRKLRRPYPQPVPDNGWDFSELDKLLAMARCAGLTRSPFTWLGHNILFEPRSSDPTTPRNMEEVIEYINQYVPAVNQFCRSKGYPQPAFYGPDEASGAQLIALKPAYEAINKAGGIATSACYPDYFSVLGTAMTLPILFGGVTSPSTERIVRATQAAGQEVWIFNSPCTGGQPPSVYRRRYGLFLWKNGENGAAPWEYSGVSSYPFNYEQPLFAFAFPTWSGKPIDTIIYEAYREGIYDTRYMATLEKYLNQARQAQLAPRLVSEVEGWLASFSVQTTQ